jgi:AcrR family transcriptional regulator
MQTFWSLGYQGSSIPQLLEATGLERGSLYQAFGDKHSLFERVFDSYLRSGRTSMREILSAEGSALTRKCLAIARRARLLRNRGWSWVSCGERYDRAWSIGSEGSVPTQATLVDYRGGVGTRVRGGATARRNSQRRFALRTGPIADSPDWRNSGIFAAGQPHEGR